jgi:predicted nucleic acid-binding protein
MLPNIALDTNIWIYLTKESFSELWEKLKLMQSNGEIEILINELILLEWSRNKNKTISTLIEGIKGEYKCAKTLANYLNPEDKARFLEQISLFSQESTRAEKARDKVEEVEEFMREKCRHVPVTEQQKLFVANLAIEKKPPFQNNKNNFNDALIVRSLSEYIKTSFYVLHDLIFVTNNPDNFLDKNTRKPHPDLLSDLQGLNLVNVTELGEALKLAPELIDELDEWLEIQLDNEAMRELDIMRGK